MSTKVSLTPVGLRPDIGLALDEFDLQANQEGFIGLRIAPAIEVPLQAGTYPIAKLTDKLRRAQTLRNDDGTYNGSDMSRNTGSYKTEDHGHVVVVDDRSKKKYEHVFDADMESAEIGRDVVLRGHNQRVIEKALAISNNDAASAVWTNTGTDIITDIRTAKLAIRNRGGGKANVLVVEYEVFEYMRDNDAIIDRLKYSGHQNPNRGSIDEIAVAQALGLDEIIVADSLDNTANEGQAASLAPQWDKTKALLFTRRTNGTTAKAQFMRTFHWGEDGSTVGGAFEKYRDENKRAFVVRSRMETQEKVLYDACGQVLTGVAA